MPHFIVRCHRRRDDISCLIVFCELTIEPSAEAIGDGNVFLVRFIIFVLVEIGGYCNKAMKTVDTELSNDGVAPGVVFAPGRCFGRGEREFDVDD